MNSKILITYKENYENLKSEILVPIQTGRALSNEKFEGMLGDDTGENISSENNKYSELTAQYWAWKNYKKLGNPDYIGHMQYRRHFIFNKDAIFNMHTPENQLNGFSVRFVDKITDDYIENIGLDRYSVNSAIKKHDITVVKKSDMTYIGCKNAKEDFLKHVPGSRETDYNILANVLLKHHPEYEEVFNKFEYEPYRHFYHMFVMKKEIFFEYCNFIFPLLKEIDSLIDYSCRGTRGGRVLGYLGEMLFCLFVFKKQEEGLEIGEYYSTVILNNNKVESTKRFNELCKKKEEQCIVYNVNDSNFYFTLRSIFTLDEYLKDEKTYDLVIFYNNLNSKYLDYLNTISFNKFNNIIIQWSENFQFQNEAINKHSFLKSLYVLRDYKNLVYINSRVCFNNVTKFSEYRNEEINVAMHPQIAKIANTKTTVMKYISNILELEDPYKYFIDDIIFVNTSLLNLKKISKIIKTDLTLIPKQVDILNYIFKNEKTFLPENFLMERSMLERKKYFSDDEYFNALKNCTCFYIPNEEFFTIENLKYLRKTPFYEEIILNMVKVPPSEDLKLRKELALIHFPNINYHDKLQYVMCRIPYFKLKKFSYKIKKAFSCGDRRKRYQEKYDKIEKLIKDAINLKKQYKRI
jgi:hypothetical protein